MKNDFLALLIATTLILSMNLKLYSYSNDIKKNEKVITIGNNINIRLSPNIKSKVISQVNIGDIVDVIDITTNIVDVQIEEKNYDFTWIKIKFKNIRGWACNAYFAPSYVINKKKNFIAWAEFLEYEGATNPYNIVCFDMKTKKELYKAKVDASEIYFSDLGNYFAIDAGTDWYGELNIGKLPSCNIILNLGHDRSIIKWRNDSFIYRRLSNENQEYDKKTNPLVEYIFKDDKVSPVEGTNAK